MAILRSKTWIDLPDNISISQLMNRNTFNTPSNKVIYEEAFTGNTVTYGQFRSDVRRAAYWLRHTLGLNIGQTVSIVAPSCIDYILAVHAVWWAGGIVSLINNSLHESEMAKAFDLIKPDYLIIHDSLWDKFPSTLSLCESKHRPQILTLGKQHSTWLSFPEGLRAEAHELEPYSLDGRNPKTVLCAILLSSGTTGRPKGVMLSHFNMVSAIHQLHADNPSNWRSSQREIFFPPLSHVYALYVCITGVFWLGAYACLMPRFQLEPYCRLLQDRQATLARLVPPVAKQLAENPIVARYKYPKLEYFSCSAAPLNLETAEKLRKAFPGVVLCQTYGCTELSGPCVQSGVRDTKLPITAAGTLIANIEMKFMDVDGSQASARGPGEITVRGPNVMMGYKDDPAATKKTILEDGWLRTGDLGYIDDNGFLVVFDRLKDIIKYNGFQVSPLELEEILVQHPLVDEAAICGVWSDADATELARAYVVLKGHPDSKTELGGIAELLSGFVSDRVAHYKQLKGGIVFVPELPKNPTGKVLRRILREQANKDSKHHYKSKL